MVLAVALLLALVLPACGFEPLHAERGGADAAALGAIEVRPIADRAGQMLWLHLTERLNQHGSPASPAWVLDVRLEERQDRLGERRDGTATRGNLMLVAHYRLAEAASGRPATAGRVTSMTSFNILDNPFATLSAEDDARARGLRELAETLRLRLAAHLAART